MVGLIGLKGAGVMRIVNLLEGRGHVSSGTIDYQKSPYVPTDILDANENKIFVIRRDVTLLLDFSIAENLFLMRRSVRSFSVYSEKTANEETNRVLEEFGIGLSADMLCSTLTRFEKMLVELVKISIQRPRIIVLYDFLADFSPRMIELLKRVFRMLVKDGVSIIVAINEYAEIIDDFDKLYIVTEGHIGKTLYRGEFGQKTITEFLRTDAASATWSEKRNKTPSEPYLRLQNACTNAIKDLSIEVYESEIVGVYDSDYSCGEEISRLLVGDRALVRGDYFVAGERLKNVTCSAVLKHKVGFVSCLENALLFPGLTAQENATVVVWDRTHKHRFLFKEKFCRFAFGQIRDYTGVERNEICQDLDDKKQLLLQLSRWQLFNPKLLIVERPFMNGDVVQAQMIQDYLVAKTKEGCSSIVISSNLNYVKRICDRIVYMKSGTMCNPPISS